MQQENMTNIYGAAAAVIPHPVNTNTKIMNQRSCILVTKNSPLITSDLFN